MFDRGANKKRRDFLKASVQVLSGVVAGGSVITAPVAGSAESTAAEEPAVIGYPN